jgi:hypothetical protein
MAEGPYDSSADLIFMSLIIDRLCMHAALAIILSG